MLEILFEIIFMLILRYPGARIRWLISRLWKSKKTYKEFLDDTVELNAIVGFLFFIIIFILIFSLID